MLWSMKVETQVFGSEESNQMHYTMINLIQDRENYGAFLVQPASNSQ